MKEPVVSIPARRGGQVLVVILVNILLLAFLVFYVFELGQNTVARTSCQNIADSVAISGANWMARSMNVIASNNINEARLVSLVPVYDSIPLAAEAAAIELRSNDYNLNNDANTLYTGLFDIYGNLPNTRIEQMVDPTTKSMVNFLQKAVVNEEGKYANQAPSQFAKLVELANMFDSNDKFEPNVPMGINIPSGYPIRNITHWDIGTGSVHGQLWDAAIALDSYSQATAATAGTLAQSAATSAGSVYSTQATDFFGFLTPLAPVLPARRGSFSDLVTVVAGKMQVDGNGANVYDPMPVIDDVANLNPGGAELFQSAWLNQIDKIYQDALGGAIPDAKSYYRLGPFARLYDSSYYPFRVQNTVTVGRTTTDPGYSGTAAFGGVAPITTGGQTNIFGYTTRGPFRWDLDTVSATLGARVGGPLNATTFSKYLRQIACFKLAYLFGAPVQNLRYNFRWITDYNQAKAYCSMAPNDPNMHIAYTLWYKINVGSAIDYNTPEWLVDPKTYYFIPHVLYQLGIRQIAYNGGGMYDVAQDPAITQPPLGRPDIVEWAFEQVGYGIWRLKTHKYMTWSPSNPPQWNSLDDPRLNLKRIYDTNGNPINWHIWAAAWYIFGGVQIYDKTPINENPFNWIDPNVPSPPYLQTPPDIPAPLLIKPDDATGDYTDDPNVGFRRNRFTYLGVFCPSPSKNTMHVGQTSAANPSDLNPFSRHGTVAQAKVFNNASWDLWTQKWEAQLMPVAGWQDWMAQMDPSAYPTSDSTLSGHATTARGYLNRFNDSLTGTYITH